MLKAILHWSRSQQAGQIKLLPIYKDFENSTVFDLYFYGDKWCILDTYT